MSNMSTRIVWRKGIVMRTDIFRKNWLFQWALSLLMLGGFSVAQAQQYVEDYARMAQSTQMSPVEAYSMTPGVYHQVSGQNSIVTTPANTGTPVPIQSTAPAQAAPAPAAPSAMDLQMAQMQEMQAMQMAQEQAMQMEPRTIVSPNIAGGTDGLFLGYLNSATNAQNGGFFLNGYIAQGIMYGNNKSDNLAPVGGEEGYQMNQLYLTAGKNVCQTGGFSFGFRADVLYGTDYYGVQAMGLETNRDNTPRWNKEGYGFPKYGIALPQAYIEMYLPVLNGTVLRVGHFASVLGYEVPLAPGNFFHTHTYASANGMPSTMSGVMSFTRMGYGWSFVLGCVNSWNALDCLDNNPSLVAGLRYEYGKNAFGATVMTGKQNVAGNMPLEVDDVSYWATIVNTYAKFALTQRLTYVIEFTGAYDDREYRCLEKWVKTGNCIKNGRSWIGLTNRLFYQLTDTVAIGARFEWFRDFDSSVIDGGYGATINNGSADYLALTLGTSWTPFSWLIVRPEVRCDWSNYSDFDDNSVRTYDNYTRNYQVTYGVDAIVKF